MSTELADVKVVDMVINVANATKVRMAQEKKAQCPIVVLSAFREKSELDQLMVQAPLHNVSTC